MGVRNAAHAGLAGHSLPVQSAASLAAMQVTIIAMSSRRENVRRVDCCQERVQIRRRVVACSTRSDTVASQQLSVGHREETIRQTTHTWSWSCRTALWLSVLETTADRRSAAQHPRCGRRSQRPQANVSSDRGFSVGQSSAIFAASCRSFKVAGCALVT